MLVLFIMHFMEKEIEEFKDGLREQFKIIEETALNNIQTAVEQNELLIQLHKERTAVKKIKLETVTKVLALLFGLLPILVAALSYTTLTLAYVSTGLFVLLVIGCFYLIYQYTKSIDDEVEALTEDFKTGSEFMKEMREMMSSTNKTKAELMKDVDEATTD